MVLHCNRTMPLDAPIADSHAALHRRLATFNRRRTATSDGGLDWLAALQAEYRLRRIEHDFVEAESAALRSQAREAPEDPDQFVEWIEQLGLGRSDALFPFLAEEASFDQLRWYLQQEDASDAGFLELSELTQSRFAPPSKSLNCRIGFYESEQRAGASDGGSALDRLGRTLANAQQAGESLDESLALSNLMVALAANRRYAYHSAGALAVREASAHERRRHIRCGLDRLGMQPEAYGHLPGDGCNPPARAWGRETLRALVANEPAAASAIAEGALLRLTLEARCFERYRNELQQFQPFGSERPAALGSLPQGPSLHA